MGFSRQEYWSGLPFPSPGDLLRPRIEPVSPALAGGFFTPELPGKPHAKVTQLVSDGAHVWTRALGLRLLATTVGSSLLVSERHLAAGGSKHLASLTLWSSGEMPAGYWALTTTQRSLHYAPEESGQSFFFCQSLKHWLHRAEHVVSVSCCPTSTFLNINAPWHISFTSAGTLGCEAREMPRVQSIRWCSLWGSCAPWGRALLPPLVQDLPCTSSKIMFNYHCLSFLPRLWTSSLYWLLASSSLLNPRSCFWSLISTLSNGLLLLPPPSCWWSLFVSFPGSADPAGSSIHSDFLQHVVVMLPPAVLVLSSLPPSASVAINPAWPAKSECVPAVLESVLVVPPSLCAHTALSFDLVRMAVIALWHVYALFFLLDWELLQGRPTILFSLCLSIQAIAMVSSLRLMGSESREAEPRNVCVIEGLAGHLSLQAGVFIAALEPHILPGTCR